MRRLTQGALIAELGRGGIPALIILFTQTCIKSLRAGPDLHVGKRAIRMRTGNHMGVLDCCVEVCGLDMFAECDAAVIMEAVIPKLWHILSPSQFVEFPEGFRAALLTSGNLINSSA
jgi:hypothetical protein